MRVQLGVSFGLTVLLMLTVPAQSEYLLNCRLMDPGSPDYKRYCVGDRSYVDCNPQGICSAKSQNFQSVYARQPSSTDAAHKNGSTVSGGPLRSGTLSSGALSGVSTTASSAGGLIGGAGSTTGSVLGRVTQ